MRDMLKGGLVGGCFKDDITTTSAVAAVGLPKSYKLFAVEGDAPIATLASGHCDPAEIDKVSALF